jgi:hypothetical protein
MYNTLSIGGASMFVMNCFAFLAPVLCLVLSCHVTNLFAHDTYAHSRQIC